jgi:hypothetical protein
MTMQMEEALASSPGDLDKLLKAEKPGRLGNLYDYYKSKTIHSNMNRFVQ